MAKKIPDELLTDAQRKTREERARFYAKHAERLKAEAKERYKRTREKDPKAYNDYYTQLRNKNREGYNKYHREYRKRPDSPQLKGEFSRTVRRTAATTEKRIDHAVSKTLIHVSRVMKTLSTKRRMLENGQTCLTAKALKEYIRSLKVDKSCMDCGNPYPFYVLEFDHRDPSIKVTAMSQAKLSDGFFTTADVDAEVAKCDLICSNCHKIRTYNRRLQKV